MTVECRIFSVEEADRTLPLVRRIVEDLLQAHGRWAAAVRALDEAAGPPGPGEAAEAAVQACAAEVQAHLDELAAVGCVFKGFEGGLVDFYSLREDRLVFLCWRRGEAGIQYWHELDAGFAGRQAIDDNLFTEALE